VALILSFIYYFKKLYLLIRCILKTKGVKAIKKELKSRGGEIKRIKSKYSLFNSAIYSKSNYKSIITFILANKSAL
jgi:hypothetical protein